MTKRLAFILFPVVGLVFGLLTGWLRIGWNIPMYGLAGFHGVLMLGGFLGSLICFEKAIMIKKSWAYIVPLLSGLSIFAFLLNQASIGYLLQISASFGLVMIYVLLVNSTKGYDILLPLIGAMCWMAGNVLLYQTQFYPTVFPWWIAFILFTIVGERLELPFSYKHKRLLYVLLLITLVGFMLPYHGVGRTVTAAGMISIALWLLRFDLTGPLLKKKGHYLYTGLTLTFGYVWLLMAAVFMVFITSGAFALDALLHSFFLGFAMSIIFAHGSIMFPALLHKSGPRIHRIIWIWFGVFQASVAARIIADLLTMPLLRKWAGMVNGIIILFFLITMFVLVQKGRTLGRK
ncbi:hypothetical protein [Roseivirga echinicomitans]|uniref:Opacity-associated protein A-like N-terminal domain-containing protein n=1 Tax=Roseivirga echinicomitans TaxID=296218 RepID=A0A150XLJ8_9BACT|nr:hypothetical protein [Roseivirga echinicomitans]KYG79627.1 hypothetical protein AWN68_17635 [Roseivirga echinicomitans]